MVIVRKPSEGTFLFPMDKASGEITFPQSLVGEGETFHSTAKRILENTCRGELVELKETNQVCET